MSSSKSTDEPEFKFQVRPPKINPPGYDIVLSETQGQQIAELLDMPGWKVLKNVFVAQRKDHIARQALNAAQTTEQLQYYKGMAAELQLFFITVKRLRDAAMKPDEEKKDSED